MTLHRLRRLAALICAAVVLYAVAVRGAADICPDGASSGVTAYCGFVGPEDLVLYDDRYLIISTMEPADYLYGFELASEAVSRLETRFTVPSAAQRWGDPSCNAPLWMSSHGLDLSRREDGELQLLVVNHGDRESIEYFSVEEVAGEPLLQWRGCVLAADNAEFNDVAGLPDGGFLATDPITHSLRLMRMMMASVGISTGRVYRWRPGGGYEEVPNTRSRYPNGILLSADGKSFYLNVYLAGEVREHALEDGRLLNRVKVKKPDNSSLTNDGKLLVASHDANVFTLLGAVGSAPDKRNDIAYEIVEIDTQTFQRSVRYRSDGRDMGAGTIAQGIGDELYIGSFRGDRIIRVTAPAAP